MTQNFPAPDNSKSVNQHELDVLAFWKQNDIFQQTINARNPKNEFRFFDGPPFATGSPHYGHILAGAIKDVIPRYKTMQGYRVNRKWGWDCHGVPVEFLIEKEHNIGGKPGIEAMGVGKFNELCRDAVMRCADEWEGTVERMGRFVDFKNDYKTMDPEFMESVWWVFKTLWDKGLIYEGEKVIAYSPKLGSPLSNFEANLNYKKSQDPAVTARFELLTNPGVKDVNPAPTPGLPQLVSDKKTYFLAWTTTPWTLPSNVGLGFGKNHSYILVEHEGAYYWIAEDAASKHFSEDFEVLDRKLGKEFLNVAYKPLFDFYRDKTFGLSKTQTAKGITEAKRFVCIHDDGDYVSTDSGTGIVHFAPSFGAEDADLCQKFDIYGVNPIDESGYFTNETPPLDGLYFRADNEVEGSKEANANKWVMKALEESGDLFKKEQITHDYPFCWRTDCALMYRGLKTWFVNVEKIKERMIATNKDINWLPDHLKEGRFGKILEGAPDWAISRNRYWGAPIPVWRCENEACGHIEVMGSRSDLETKASAKVDDLHKHFVDDLTWDCAKCNETKQLSEHETPPVLSGSKMVRIEEVLDCWFESGSMPYGSTHYPFENKEKLEQKLADGTLDFPSADFIAEGLDQTRGWFYSLHVLGCALFDKNIYKNVITNGIILAEDGQKMSKSKKNYPDPNLIFDQYGADSMRYYLLSSPAVRAENFRFVEQGVSEVLKTIILPLRSTYQFFSTYANIDNWKPTNITFIRHGEGEHNVTGTYSGKIDNPHKLTANGVLDCEALKEKLPEFDAVYASPFVRTKQTADILFGANNYQLNGKIVEIDFGDLEGKAYRPVRERLKDTSGEMLDSVQARMTDFVAEVATNHPGESVAVVSHGGAIRYGRAYFEGFETLDEVLTYDVVNPGETADFICPPKATTELDKWIISELQIVLKNYREKMDAYKIDESLRDIAPFIDNLNNWYLRRSRKRFWAAGMTPEKISGYETLHYVLRTLARILAPTMPFFSEKLHKDLTDNLSVFPEQNSVHLQYIPDARECLIDESLSQSIGLMREVVSLSASIRARANVKLRQPLQKLQFAVSSGNTVRLSEDDLAIIAGEANVKKVEILQSVEGLATAVIKVDARQVGKKFGSKVQQLIAAGKSGDFVLNADGTVNICDEVLEAGEYETAFLTEEGSEADSTPNAVVILDTELTPELEREGEAREIIRAIQDLRKSSGFEVSDRIEVTFETNSDNLNQTVRDFGDQIKGEVLANSLSGGTGEHELNIEDQVIKLSLTKS